MPALESEEILTEYLLEVGPATSSQMGMEPISFTEIANWSKLVGIELSSWEVSTVHQMSVSYTNGYSLGQDPASTAPYKTLEIAPEKIAAGVDDIFAQINKHLKSKGRK